jgi:putative PIN family toxin of toxin-antitoxin system
MKPYRVVLDSNVVLSAVLWRGRPGSIVELAGERELLLFTSRALPPELTEVLQRHRFASQVAKTGNSVRQMLARYRRLASVVTTSRLPGPVSRDADDDAVRACAVAARAEYIVTGDQDLLVLAEHAGIQIVTVAAMLTIAATR